MDCETDFDKAICLHKGFKKTEFAKEGEKIGIPKFLERNVNQIQNIK